MKTVTFEDVSAAMHCPLATAAGYEPEPLFEDPELSRKILEDWPNDTTRLRKLVSSERQAVKWMSRTRFGMATGPAQPPSPQDRNTDYWTDGRIGHARVSLAGDRQRIAVCHLPYLHKINASWEVVYCRTQREPMDLRRRKDMILRAQWDQSVFRHITGETLFSRLLAPAYQHEEALSVPDTSVTAIIQQQEALQATPVATPGLHCSDVKGTRHSSGKKREWRCPVREQDNCSAIRAFHSGNADSNTST